MPSMFWHRHVSCEWLRCVECSANHPLALHSAEIVGHKGDTVFYLMADRANDGEGSAWTPDKHGGRKAPMSKPRPRDANEDQRTAEVAAHWREYDRQRPDDFWALNSPQPAEVTTPTPEPKPSMLTKVLRFVGVRG
jgi:hypothetical protein